MSIKVIVSEISCLGAELNELIPRLGRNAMLIVLARSEYTLKFVDDADGLKLRDSGKVPPA